MRNLRKSGMAKEFTFTHKRFEAGLSSWIETKKYAW